MLTNPLSSTRHMLRPRPPARFLAQQQQEVCTDGIIELAARNLQEKGFRNTTTAFALCSPCLHVSQRGQEGYDWSCGYRNIQVHLPLISSDLVLHVTSPHTVLSLPWLAWGQMMCHSLLNHPVIDYRR